MELSEYNGWENKFTWLVHLHLSNEQALMHDIVAVVARTVDDRTAGLHVKWWVEDMVKSWVTGFSRLEAFSDEPLRLLVWDMVGAALAYADWDVVVQLLLGQVTTSDNPFTCTLHKSIMTVRSFHEPTHVLLQSASSSYACADALHVWFREHIDAWVGIPHTQRGLHSAMVMLVHSLIQDTYSAVYWEHVARAFRPGY